MTRQQRLVWGERQHLQREEQQQESKQVRVRCIRPAQLLAHPRTSYHQRTAIHCGGGAHTHTPQPKPVQKLPTSAAVVAADPWQTHRNSEINAD